MNDEGTISVVMDSSIERLQTILQTEQKRSLPIGDVREIAYDLISFFELLAEGSNDQ